MLKRFWRWIQRAIEQADKNPVISHASPFGGATSFVYMQDGAGLGIGLELGHGAGPQPDIGIGAMAEALSERKGC